MSSELIAMPSAKGGDSEMPAVSSSCAEEGAVGAGSVMASLEHYPSYKYQGVREETLS
jgi:hypothetical protein